MIVFVSAWAPPQPVLAQGLDGESEAAPTVYEEDEVKAAFLYNFSTYVEWPSDSAQTITIAVLGAPAVADELARVVRGRTIQGIPVRVRRLRAISQLNDDDVLYIGPAENRRLSQLIEAVDGRPTLLVTDAPDGLARGAMINFRIVDRRVRFEVSVPRAQDAGLMLSSRLLSAALYVETSRRGPLPRRSLPAYARGGKRLVQFGAPPQGPIWRRPPRRLSS